MAQYYKWRLDNLENDYHIPITISQKSEREIHESLPYTKYIPFASCDDDNYEWSMNPHFSVERYHYNDASIYVISVFVSSGQEECSSDQEFDGQFVTPYGNGNYKISLLPNDINIILQILEDNGDIEESDFSDSDEIQHIENSAAA